MSTTVSIQCAKGTGKVVARAAVVLAREIRERSKARVGRDAKAGLRIELAIEAGIGTEGFRIEDAADGGIRVVGNDALGVVAGVGKLLRTARYGKGSFAAGDWRGESVPEKPVRGMYFASHFHNFYHDAPVAKVERYVEELALWGCNTLAVWFDMHHYTGMNEPAAKAMIRRLRAILKAANRIGMSGALTTLANEGFSTSPESMRADWTAGHDGYHSAPGGHYHVEICPNKPGGLAKIIEYRDAMLRAFKGIDIGYVWLWPYDQGGCTCSKCTPWGANGFIKAAKAEALLAKKHFPKAKMILSTWYFDHFIKGEWEAFDKVVKKTRPTWFDYVLADDYGTSFPPYVVKNGIPGGFPMVTFAEISMFDTFPWGGYGANPLPQHFQEIWNASGRLAAGGFPYSEGIFEDINKVIQFQFFWDSKRTAMDTVREYIAYEFSPGAIKPLARAAELMEKGHPHYLNNEGVTAWVDAVNGGRKVSKPNLFILKQPDHAEACFEAVRKAEKQLTPRARQSWRWRIFFLRAQLDVELKRSKGVYTRKAERCFQELEKIYSARAAESAVVPPTLKALMRVRTHVTPL